MGPLKSFVTDAPVGAEDAFLRAPHARRTFRAKACGSNYRSSRGRSIRAQQEVVKTQPGVL
eukprot:7415372-Pyramimonas_sp.AAC.1